MSRPDFPPSPLDRLLTQLTADQGVPALARWARRLLDGEAAQSGTAEPECEEAEEGVVAR